MVACIKASGNLVKEMDTASIFKLTEMSMKETIFKINSMDMEH